MVNWSPFSLTLYEELDSSTVDLIEIGVTPSCHVMGFMCFGNCFLSDHYPSQVSMGWGLCPLPHSSAGTTYQRELSTAHKLSSNKRTQSSSTVEKQSESRTGTAESKTHKISTGLYPGRSTFHDFRIRDGGEERGFSSSFSRSHSPRHVPFKHSECNAQHMTNYRYTFL